MQDEAAPYYTDMIDQTTLGHRFLKEELNTTPRIGWQIDPFGHSAVQGYLMGAELGFEAMFLGRIDFQDLDRRRKAQELEMVWRASSSLGASADIWALVLGSGNYGPPAGFCFDDLCDDPPIMDDVNMKGYNVDARVYVGVARATVFAWWFLGGGRGGDIMFTMGSDFQYSNARMWYKNLDKLIKHANLDGRLNLFYSTPSAYLAAKHAAGLTLPLKTDDFFPYADNLQAFWTGYFTSRAALKGYVKVLSNTLQAARHLEWVRAAFFGGDSDDHDDVNDDDNNGGGTCPVRPASERLPTLYCRIHRRHYIADRS
jgi:alpha-mannosidase